MGLVVLTLYYHVLYGKEANHLIVLSFVVISGNSKFKTISYQHEPIICETAFT